MIDVSMDEEINIRLKTTIIVKEQIHMNYLRSVKNTIKEDILNENIIMHQLHLTKQKK